MKAVPKKKAERDGIDLMSSSGEEQGLFRILRTRGSRQKPLQ